MKKLLPCILCLVLLSSCAATVTDPEPTAGESASPVTFAPSPTFEPTPETEEFVFTAENYPRVDGSTATIPLIEAVESVLLNKPRAEVSARVSKTSQAYRALSYENADILFVYDGGEETRREVDADTMFETVPIGKDALVFVVNRNNPVDSLTTEQVREIFSGKCTNWSELGGSDEAVRAYQRGLGSGSQALMDKLVMKELPMADTTTIKAIADMGGLIDAVANYTGGPTGIGYNVYFYVTEMKKNDDIKILKIDGVEPNYETIQSGEYPFVSEFYSVIRKSEPQDSPARKLHEWMLTAEAQNLMASENYVALYADPDAETPQVDGEFSFYPDGEAPEFLEGKNRYALEPSDDYGELYFYLGSEYYDLGSIVYYYGLCDADGKIVTEPVYTMAKLLIDSHGNKAYFCNRSDLEPISMVKQYEWGENVELVYPALLFATDGSWVMELEAVRFFFGFSIVSEEMRNADYLAVMKNGKWGAVNLLGETVIPFNRDTVDEIYGSKISADYNYLSVTADRFLALDYENPLALVDGDGTVIASGIQGDLSGVAGDYFITSKWDDEGIMCYYTYNLDGVMLASYEPDEPYSYAGAVGDYVKIDEGRRVIITDRYFNVVGEFTVEYNEAAGYGEYIMPGAGVLHRSDPGQLLHRTYLPDGTRLVTWYDPGMSEWERTWW